MADARHDATSREAGRGATAVVPPMHPLDYVRVLYRRRWLVVVVLGLVLGGAATYTYRAVPLYQAQVTLLIESDEPNIVDFKQVLDEGLSSGDYYLTQYELLQSRALAERTVKALDLTTRPGFAPTEAAAIGIVRAGLRVVPVRGTRMVNLQFRSPDPALAAEIANAHAREYIGLSLDTRFKASKEATEWLDEQLREERKRVEQVESALQAYREQNDAVSLAAGQDIVVQKLADLNAAVTRAKTGRIEKEAQYRALLAARGDVAALDSFPAILSNSFVQQLKGDLAGLQREYSQLSGTLGERHPTLLAKRTEVETTEKRLAAEVGRIVESTRNAYQAALAEEASMTAALEQQKREALAVDRRGIEYAALEREAQSVRLVYQSLLQRAKETSVARDLRSTNIRVLDAAERPRGPVWPRRTYNMVLAALLGSVLALGLAFGLEYLDDRVHTPDDIWRHLGLPSLALVPEIPSTEATAAVLSHEELPDSLIEPIRAMRTNVVSAMPGEGPRSLLVASASQHEGKTFVASSLAVALAHAGHRVLLIDADLRRPGLHKVVGDRLEPGLSNLLAGTATLHDVLQPSAVANLTVMTAGSPSMQAPELLGSTRFEELFRICQEHYTWVVIDAPPALSVTDASLLGRHTSAVLVVIASGSTRSRAARRAVEELQRAGGTVLGAVLNRVPVQHHPFYFAPYARTAYPAPAGAMGRVSTLSPVLRRSA